MIRGFYAAGSGLSAQQIAIDNTANNIANVNTNGYKKQNVSFSELLNSSIIEPVADGPQNLKVGNGTRIAQITTVQNAGSFSQTDRELDFAISSEGFFGLMDNAGNMSYTRDGNFKVSAEADGNYLVSADGKYVVDVNNERILLDGSFFADRLGIFDFINSSDLTRLGNNSFGVSDTSGEALAVPGMIKQGFLEASNVNLVDEMSKLISIQRAYQLNASAIKTADEVEDIVNRLR